MTRRRQPPPEEPTTLTDDIAPTTPWRHFVPPDADLDRIARDLSTAARWSLAQTDIATDHPLPQPTHDASTDIDALDTWLLDLDTACDLNGYQGRRRACWANCMDMSK